MFDLDYAILILNIFVLFIAVLTIYKPIFLFIGIGLSGTLIIQVLTGTVETFTRSITILTTFLNSCAILIGIGKGRDF